ncbi:MAG: tRNA (adenosine(37)-N6)-threonylcarbamoyltransferase complex dimerization subunit type 1 TsaB [Alphaproteobacteria bacterium 16-39-46]|nr:MAG: tRNA (adenosine(37)-N6)-threonylcarbamoyltransferase complex dimerization subunit type 1 TsaB [Alphaproteobacteria bacterium 16-39-46]OZA44216.1 MAG: tRNA (adenosine(37)-N6)-threonylcarbamoyltransferase complex dimerization subunit type 1 TsaB [Alphaproteobacteria bacterium 17-39-52]HQS84944.1 tRNA (adenosine(37)-N6)-threonylcarbamoyltransferase complex dimerization subunit type 1 TsaB [Alphaproteobacteria bacterium]HQS94710.1 tRNA (adenosine(37)-N6)-threonylcarbamoyltransferase complex 
MVILAYSTISDILSIALLRQGESTPFAVFQERVFRDHATVLIPRIQALLEKESLRFEDLEAIAVCCGPGSFTGARIACAAALGFSAFKEIPLLGISTFQMYAKLLFEKTRTQNTPSLILLKSGHHEFCVEALGRDLLPFQGPFEKPECLEEQDLLGLLKNNKTSYIVGGDALSVLEDLKETPLTCADFSEEGVIWAEWIGKAAMSLMEENIYPPPVPLYVRPAYVKIPEGLTDA